MKEHPAIKMPLDSLGHLCERLPAGVRDPHAHNASLSTVGDHALALRGCESGLDQFDHHVDRESVRTQDRLGATVTAPCKQFEGAAAVRIGAAVVVWPSHRCATMINAPARRENRRADEQGNHEQLSQSWRHVRIPILMRNAAQAPRPASLAGKGGRAGACHDARGCVVTNRPTRCSRALVKLQSQFRLRLFGVETASPHGQAVQHKTGHEGQNHNQ